MELRFERKYTLPEELGRDLELFLKLHPEAVRRAYPPRWVNSVYLDTPDFADFHRHVEGASRRSKLRIRWYGDLEGDVAEPQLEAKVKVNLQNGKRRASLSPARVELAGLPAQTRRWLAEVKDADPIKRLTLNVAPLTLVRYHRQYYQVAACDCRLTIDTRMTWHGPAPGGAAFRLAAKAGNVVLEFKYPAAAPDGLIADIVDRFPVRNTRYSKYLHALRASFPP